MPYHIEIVCYSSKLYADIGAAVRMLNHAQEDTHGNPGEIIFDLPPFPLRSFFYHHALEEHLTTDVFKLLTAYREQAKGDRRYLIAIVEGKLQSPKLGNLFGSRSTEQPGLAVITVKDFQRYVASRKSYLAFFLIRFAISFIAPERYAHTEEPSCIFHKRIDRRELVTALYRGKVCDECRKEFAAKMNASVSRAVERMLGAMRIGLPEEGSTQLRERRALVLKGGGVKGLALVGAVLELDGWFEFDEFVGTSAGSIVAALLALGCSPNDLESMLRKTDFGAFKDSGFLLGLWNLIRFGYIHSGANFENWFWSQIEESYIKRTDRVQPPKMRDVDRHLVIFASQRNSGLVRFDSEASNSRSDYLVTFAVRASMNIPGFFKAPNDQGQPMYDGGLVANFPLKEWIELYPDRPFLGIYLGAKVVEPRTSSGIFKDTAEIIATRDDYMVIDRYRNDVVMVDPSPIGTAEFGLGKLEMDFLVLEGRAAALEHMARRDMAPEVARRAKAARQLASAAREAVIARKSRKRQLRLFIFGIIVLATSVLAWIWWS